MNRPLPTQELKGAKVWGFSVFVFFTGLILTLFAGYFASRALRLENESQFASGAQSVQSAMETRMEAYLALLRSGAALMGSSTGMTRLEFRGYVERLRLNRQYPGVQGVGVAFRVLPSERAEVSKRMKEQGVPDFKVWPESAAEESFPVVYVEPGEDGNRKALGYDMFSDPIRRAAMEQARAAGEAAATSKLTLMQDGGSATRPAFLIYVPFYRGGTSQLESLRDPEKLSGFVFAAFRAQDLFTAILGKSVPADLNVEVYDGSEPRQGSLIYRTGRAKASRTSPFFRGYTAEDHLLVAAHTWSIRYWSQPEFESSWFVVPLILVLGMVLSVALAQTTLNQSKARQVAEQSTRELRVSQDALREAELRQRLMIENASDYAIFALDTEGKVTSWNSGAQKIFGFSETEILGQNGGILFTPEDRERGVPEREIATAAKEGSARDERWHARKDGSRFFASGVVRPMYDSSGTMRGFIKVARDFTERMQAQQKVIREKQFSDTLINSLPGIFYLFTEAGRILRWNDNFQRITGYASRDIATMHPLDFFDVSEQEKIAARILEVFERGQATVESELLTKDGVKIPFFFTGRFIEINQLRCVLGAGIDISERRRVERSLEEAQGRLRDHAAELEVKIVERTARLEESLKSIEGVLYHVAHDLRAPLRAMASFTDILRFEYASILDARAIDYLDRIGGASHRMDELVTDLLAYGRLTHMSVPLKEVDLEEQTHLVLSSLSSQVEQRHADVEIMGPLPRAKGNPGVLQEVLGHLLVNALQFVPPDVQPRVRIRGENGNVVRLWVEDNGIGIPPEHHDRIFRMFERLHPSPGGSGTGIGLAIVRKGVERMHGRAGVESAPGQGSRFWIELPPVSES